MQEVSVINEELIHQGYAYDQFQQLTKDLLAEDKATSGNDTEMPLLEFTKLNLQRMSRLDKTITLNEDLTRELQEIPEKWCWLVLAEGWCGDVAQNLPAIAKMAAKNPDITLKILLRDENPEVMDQYTTHGSRSIPKLICFNVRTLEEKGNWGPRPEPLQQKVLEQKQQLEEKMSRKEMVDQLHETMHKWYTQDNTHTQQQEFLSLIKNWKSQ